MNWRPPIVVALLAGLLIVSCVEQVEPDPPDLETLDTADVELRGSGDDDRLQMEPESPANVESSTSIESDRLALPFAPPIAMDPVDGSKVSIRTDTPTASHGNLIYYFRSEENRAAFMAEPERYVR